MFALVPRLLQAATVVFTFAPYRSNSVVNILDIATNAFLEFVELRVELEPELASIAITTAVVVFVVFPTLVPFRTMLYTFVHIPVEV